MFFDLNQINSKLTCKKCEERLDEPRLLPCGSSICSFCSSSIKLTNNKEFQCFICNESHEMPKKGLPISKALLEILSFEAIHVSRGNALDTLQKTSQELHKNKIKFKYCLYNTTDYIKEHFMDLRNEVQIATEDLHEKVNDLNEQVIIELNDYEKHLISLNDNKSLIMNESLKSFEIIDKDLDFFHFQTQEYLKEPKLNDELLGILNQEAIVLRDESENQIENIKEIILKGNYIKFKFNKEKLNKSIFGEMCQSLLKSSILKENSILKNKLMFLCEFPVEQKWILIYRGSYDGFEAAKFHHECDNTPNTLTIIKSTSGNIFGGYTEKPWSNIGDCIADPNAFIFSLTNKENRPLKIKCSQNNGIQRFHKQGPSFGGAQGDSDLVISDNSNKNKESYSFLGHYFIHPDYKFKSEKANSFLAGSLRFRVSEIEVYVKE